MQSSLIMAPQHTEQPTILSVDDETTAAPIQQQFTVAVATTTDPAASGKRDIPLIELTIENLSYAPIVTSSSGGKNGGATDKKRKTVLNNISTKVAPYQLTAWMGPSGSGKTSLISVAADLISSDDLLDGSLISVNGEEGKIPKRLIGVVWQDDLLLSNLTVEENLFFAARLKTPESQNDEYVRKIVAETMAELGLTHVRDSLVGGPFGTVRGISGGERKRVAVGAELVARPSVLLLDEITSGLDSTTAQNLMSTLKDLTHLGHSIAVVIHQPRTAIYNMFDHLLLLSHGNVVYNGHPSKARSYLELMHGDLPPETGIADWMMDIITYDEKSDRGSQLAKQWIENRTNIAATASLSEPAGPPDIQPIVRRMSLHELRSAPSYNTGFRTQLKLLAHRTLKQQRGERLTMVAFLLQTMYLFFTALFWWRIPDDTSRIFERNSLLFFILIAQANGIVIAAVTVFQRERVLLSRERAKKMYTVSSYFIAKTLSDLTNNVILPLLYSMAVYWTAGFRASGTAYMKYIFAFYWIYSTAQSMGLFLSIAIPNPNIALVLAPPITLFFIILGGFYIPFESMHPGVQWATYLSFARYGYSALM
jgi:ABC-type multidrug transport system ATPase subunit